MKQKKGQVETEWWQSEPWKRIPGKTKKINKDCLRDFWKKDKYANNCAIVVPEGEGREKKPKKIS